MWNLPLRAIADGTVIAVFDGLDDNTVLGQFPSPTPNPGDGNSAWVQFAEGTKVVYTHVRKGTVAVAVGDTVVAGQLIGHVGNSGNTTAPHTHLEVRRAAGDSPLRPWALTDAWMVSQEAG